MLIVKCYVTSKWSLKALVVEVKILAYNYRNENMTEKLQAAEAGRRGHLQACEADYSGLRSISCEEGVWQQGLQELEWKNCTSF